MFIFTMYLNLESKVQWGFDFQFTIPLPNSNKTKDWALVQTAALVLEV